MPYLRSAGLRCYLRRRVHGRGDGNATQNPKHPAQRIGRAAGVGWRLSSHHARDTFAMALLNKYRVPIHVVSKLLGHASVVTTELHYAHLLDSSVDDYL